MSSKVNFVLSLLVFLPLLSFSEEELLTPEQAVAIALENNYSIRIARNQAELLSNNVTIGNAGFLPSVDLSALQNNNIQNIRQENLSGEVNERDNAKSNSINLNASLNWTLFDGLAMFVNYDKLKEFEAMGELAARATIERTVVNVLSSYFDLVRQKQRLQVIEKSINISEERIRIEEGKFLLGAASRVDVLQAQVDYNADRSALLNSEEDYRTSKIMLNNLMARDINILFDVVEEIEPVVLPDWLLVYESAISNNTFLLMSYTDNRIAQLELRETTSRRYPRLSTNVGYNYLQSESEAGPLAKNRTNGLNYGFTASWNVFNGFNLNRQISNARILVENSEIELTEYRARLEADLTATYLSMQSKIQLVEFEEQSIELADLNLSVALERFRLGELSGYEFRETQRNYLTAEGRLITARFQAKIVEISLRQLSGSLLN